VMVLAPSPLNEFPEAVARLTSLAESLPLAVERLRWPE
jgi:hypothetical protein